MTLPPLCAGCLEIWKPQTPRNLRACTSDCFKFTYLVARFQRVLTKIRNTWRVTGSRIAHRNAIHFSLCLVNYHTTNTCLIKRLRPCRQLRVTRQNTKESYALRKVSDLHGSQNSDYIPLSHWLLQPIRKVFTARYELNIFYTSGYVLSVMINPYPANVENKVSSQ